MSDSQLALPAPVPPADPIDKPALEATLAAFTVLIERALKSAARTRFGTVAQLALQAGKLASLLAQRVGDFDNAARMDEIDLLHGEGMGMIAGRNFARGQIGIAGGDQMELFRTLINEIGGMANQAKPMPPAAELRELLEAKKLMKDMGDDTTDIDTRIAALKGQVIHAVVPTELPRGHQIEAPGRHADGAVLAQVDGQGDQGADRAV